MRVGNFIGPWYKFIGATVGPDIFWQKYKVGSIELDATTGMAVPLIARIGVPQFMVYGGLQPSWYFSGEGLQITPYGEESGYSIGLKLGG